MQAPKTPARLPSRAMTPKPLILRLDWSQTYAAREYSFPCRFFRVVDDSSQGGAAGQLWLNEYASAGDALPMNLGVQISDFPIERFYVTGGGGTGIKTLVLYGNPADADPARFRLDYGQLSSVVVAGGQAGVGGGVDVNAGPANAFLRGASLAYPKMDTNGVIAADAITTFGMKSGGGTVGAASSTAIFTPGANERYMVSVWAKNATAQKSLMQVRSGGSIAGERTFYDTAWAQVLNRVVIPSGWEIRLETPTYAADWAVEQWRLA